MHIFLYTPEDKKKWDDFVAASKNGTFLFYRDYMEYHSDRFIDYSLIVRDKRGQIVALLPANQKGNMLVSHEGLTYGGFVSGYQMTTQLMLDVFEAAVNFLKKRNFAGIIYKTTPSLYHLTPAEEDRYALFLRGARCIRKDVLSVVDQEKRIPFQERRRRGVKKAWKYGLLCSQSENLAAFWRILEHNLESRHKLKPVHSVDEMQHLKERFPDSIRLFATFQGNDMMAGAVIYESVSVAHVQYSACSEEGRTKGAQDILFDYLINDYYKARTRYFDFGISTEDEGKFLNVGLIEYKEGFGARALVHNFYEIPLQETGEQHR